MTSTREMQRRASVRRKQVNRVSKIELIKKLLIENTPIEDICKQVIVTAKTIESIKNGVSKESKV